MISVLVAWESEGEIDIAFKLDNIIHRSLEDKGIHISFHEVNNPQSTFAMRIGDDMHQEIRDTWLGVVLLAPEEIEHIATLLAKKIQETLKSIDRK